MTEVQVPLLDEEGTWRRLHVRMLLIHPLRELLQSWYLLVGLIFVGARSTADGRLWGLLGVVMVIGLALARWFTTTYRVTPEQVQVRRGLLRREVLTVPRDRVRTVDVSASPLHRLLRLTRVTIGTGRSDRRDDGLRLDGITTEEAQRLRGELLHRAPAPVAEPAGDRVAEPAAPAPDTVLTQLRPAWLRYGPFSLSGLVIVAVVAGTLSRLVNESQVQLSQLGLQHTVDRLVHTSLLLAVPLVLAVLVIVVAVTSTLAYLVAFWGFRLSRQPAGTLHIVRGLLTSRSITIEERRLRGVELSEPLLLRLARGARCIAIATGLRVGRGAERGGSLLLPPAPMTEAFRVAAAVLRDDGPVAAPLTRHGPRARRRRYTRALLTTSLVPAVLALLWWQAGWPSWPVPVSLLLLVLAVPLAEDRYRALGHTLSGQFLVIREGSLVRRRNMLARDGIIGWNLRQSFFQRRAGVITVEATTAAGRQRYAAQDIPDELAVRLADRAVPDLLAPFLIRR
jgi:putative membrane protein